MKFIPLAVISAYFSILSLFAQNIQKDNSSYHNRQLKIEEINFVSGYYDQDGNNSAVTGGIGTEKLDDRSHVIDLVLSKYDERYRKHSLSTKLGVDFYTSASADNIDYVLSSASRHNIHGYGSIGWNLSNEQNRTRFGLTGSYSDESAVYRSVGIAFHFSKKSKNYNREFSLNLHTFLDSARIVYPVELRDPTRRKYQFASRNTFAAAFFLAQVINQRVRVGVGFEPTYQRGLLATKYQRAYFVDGSVQAETLPDDRYKWPISLRMSYFLGDRTIVRALYRYYIDNWGIQANTFDLELPLKITPFFSLSPFYRFHTQTAARYFAAYAMHALDEQFYTSDYDLSKLQSHFFGAGLKITPPQGILGWHHLNSIEFRYGHYTQSNTLKADSFSLALKLR